MRFYRLGDDVYPDTNMVAVEHGRPVVVIDPEDESSVDRVANAIRDHHGRNNKHVWVGIDWIATQAALRALANPTPPRPDEPTGLGAVVEDDNGALWVRFVSVESEGWQRAGWGDNSSCIYADIAVVRVLSDGVVTP